MALIAVPEFHSKPGRLRHFLDVSHERKQATWGPPVVMFQAEAAPQPNV